MITQIIISGTCLATLVFLVVLIITTRKQIQEQMNMVKGLSGPGGISISGQETDSAGSQLDDKEQILNFETELLAFIGKSEDKLRASLLAFIRAPYSKRLFDLTIGEYLKIYNPETNLSVKLGIVSQINAVIERFEANCDIRDIPHLEDTKRFITEKSDTLVKEVIQSDETMLKEKIEILGNLVSVYEEKGKIESGDYQEIKLADDDIDKEMLKKFKHLSTKYSDQVKNIQKIISDREQAETASQESKIKEYNRAALSSLKTLLGYYQEDKGTFDKGERLDEVVQLIGGFNTGLLVPEVSLFHGYVYNTIFSGLKKASSKIWLTEEMLNADERKL